jgi:tetratricopeptide (TPR) repeat protein
VSLAWLKPMDGSGAPFAAILQRACEALRPGRSPWLRWLVLLMVCHSALGAWAGEAHNRRADVFFRAGTEAYSNGDYATALAAFRQSAALHPASGTLQNLGNARWECGQTGAAILAWEQALWLNPFDGSARNNLRFARRTAQLESPDLSWYEAVSSWLPLNGWTWLCAFSVWLVVGMGLLPGIFQVRKAAWHQALAAFGLAVFLLSIPAQIGVQTRSRLGFILQKDTPLRLTPTDQAQYLGRLPAGEPGRIERVHGRYVLLRTERALGWVERSQFGALSALNAH